MKVRDHHLRLVLAAVLPVGILALVMGWVVIDNANKSLTSSLADVARAISLSVDSEVKRTITALEVLALSDRLTSNDLERFRPEAEGVMARHGAWSNVLLFRPDGERVMNLQAPPGAPLGAVRNPNVILATVATRRPQISDASVAHISGRPLVFVSVPVVRGDEVRYVLQASMEYPVWTEWLRLQLPDRWIAAIDDRKGTIFARSERPEAFVGKPASESMRSAYASRTQGVLQLRNREGEDMYSAFHTSDLSGWHVVVLTPAAVVSRDRNRFVAAVAGSYVLIVLIGFIAALWAARPLSAGISRLRHAVARLGTSERPEFRRTGIEEIDDAGDSVLRVGALLSERAARVAQLQEELERRADVAEHANRMKDQFLGMLGHEIRNPLSAISNATTVLLMRSQGQEREMHELIKRQTNHLASLVDDLLDVSRLAQGKLRLERERIDLGQIVLRVRRALETEGRAGGHEIHWSVGEAPVLADPERMTQVVRNLMDNAIRYTPAGRRIDILVGTEGARAVLVVADEGVGIEPALLEQIFQPFVQAPQEIDRKSGGLGLGLAIVKQVVELHEGTIEASSAGTGRGATFTVTLPLAGAPAKRQEDQPVPIARPHRLHLAIVEDHDDARRSLRLLLERHGCTVEAAADGERGLALLLRNRYDAAFVDLGLPGIDGYEVAQRVRRAGIGTPLIAVSGYGQEGDRARAVEAGFDDFVVKPLTEERLAGVLADCQDRRTAAVAVGGNGDGHGTSGGGRH